MPRFIEMFPAKLALLVVLSILVLLSDVAFASPLPVGDNSAWNSSLTIIALTSTKHIYFV